MDWTLIIKKRHKKSPNFTGFTSNFLVRSVISEDSVSGDTSELLPTVCPDDVYVRTKETGDKDP